MSHGGKPDFVDSETVLNAVERFSSEIYSYLAYSDAVAVCQWLQQRVSDGSDLQRDFLFKTVFKSFYGLDRARLSAGFLDKYFELFERERRRKCPDLQEIVGDLYKYGTGTALTALHFSFATKMAATIRPELGFYDGNIAALFHFDPHRKLHVPERQVPKARFARYMALLHEIQIVLRKLSGRQLIQDLRRRLRDGVSGWSTLDEMKQSDLILWTAGRSLTCRNRQGARYKGYSLQTSKE